MVSDAARWGYALLAASAYAWLTGTIALAYLPLLATLTLAPALRSIFAARELLRWAWQPAKLALAIRLTIAAALAHGARLYLALVFEAQR